ncbi:3'-5' RNA exonuclease complex component [Coemansia erecta]|nr:3'-5' RNA exonuclease complex component [Coemansia erecta]
MMSMNKLMNGLEDVRKASDENEMPEEEADDVVDEDVIVEDAMDGGQDAGKWVFDESVAPKNDRDFQKLLIKSWELFDEDLAPESKDEEVTLKTTTHTKSRTSTGSHDSSQGNRPPGSRSFHTSRQILRGIKPRAPSKNKGKNPKYNEGAAMSRAVKVKTLKYAGGKRTDVSTKHARPPLYVDRFRQQTQSLVKQVVLPTNKEIMDHITKTDGGHIHVPIEASVSVGDIVEMRVMLSSNPSMEFGSSVMLCAVAQKTTGRFHFMTIADRGRVLGSREKTIGFVAKGMMFDEMLLRDSGVSSDDIARMLAFKDELQAYEAEHGKHALTSALEATRLQQAHNQSVPQSTKSSYFGESNGDAQEEAALVDDEFAAPQVFASDSGLSAAGDPATAVVADDLEAGSGEEDNMELLLRIMPHVLQTCKEKALRLMRSHYRELNGYWAIALAQGKTSVTLDSLAELIFKTDDDQPISEYARLATYMHLINDTLHFIPSPNNLFVTNTYSLRSSKEVESIDHVRDMIRSNAPPFKRFIEKARKLVAFSYAHMRSEPSRAALSPDMASLEKSMKCDLTGRDMKPEFIESWDAVVDQVPSEQELAGITFDSDDQLFIDILCRFVHNHNVGYAYTENLYRGLVPPIVKKMNCYDGSDMAVVTRFLVDLGVWPHWYNPTLNARMLPYGSTTTEKQVSELSSVAATCTQLYFKGDSAVIDSAQADSAPASDEMLSKIADNAPLKAPWRPDLKEKSTPITQSSAGVGIIDRTRFYGRDICEDIRHDFGDLPVYTIDSAATKDVDDGVSIETVAGPDGKPHVWLHIHVADPTSVIHPGHVVADAASESMTTLYYPEAIQHMLPFDLVSQKLSVVRRSDGSPVNTMTFSVRIGDDGDIADYKVRPGLVRNITAAPYELVDRYLSYKLTRKSINSFAKLQGSIRSKTMVHPFVLTEGDWRRYGEDCGELPDAAVKELQAIQETIARHEVFRVQCGAMSSFAESLDVGINLDSDAQTTSLDKPRFLIDRIGRSDHGALAYPRIWQSYSEEAMSPAHMLVAELMVIAGRVATRYAMEHGHRGRDSVGAGSELDPVPLLYRVQQPPDLAMLNGCSPDMPLAFDNMTADEAQSAETVWNAVQSMSKSNHGHVSSKAFDEVRHMLNPGVLSEHPGPHVISGIRDKYGYTRISSPLRRMDDLVNHWQLKAQLLAEHGDARDRAPWFWNRADIARLAPIVFRGQFLANQIMSASNEFWAMTAMQRMDFEARRGRLQPPPPGFYDTSSEHYRDLPWAYYDPRNPGPLVWTGLVDNRDALRPFISLVMRSGIGARAMLMPRPLDPAMLPFAGTKLRVHIMSVNPAINSLLVKLAPEEYQPAETPRFWKSEFALSMPYNKMSNMMMLPENMRESK